MRPLAWSLLVIAGAFVWAVAKGQDLAAYLPGVPGYQAALVPPHLRPLYDPPGVHAGDLILHPHLDEGIAYDSNVFGSTPGQGSWILGTHPSLQLGTDWRRNSFGAYLGIDNWQYLSTPAQSRTDWTASAGGTITLGRDQLTLAAAHLLLHQDRTQLDALPTDQPVAYQVNDLRASYALTLSRISLTPNVEVTSYDYSPTTVMREPVSQAYRNRVLVQGGITGSYEVAPSRNLLVVLRGLDSHYTQPQANAPSRDSSGWIALAGVDARLDGLWRIRLLAGWEGREFSSPQYGNHSAPVAEADIVFSPTGLTTITGTLARTIEDAAQESVAGYVDTSARLTIDHEYARNILLQAYGSVQQAAYLQGGGSQTGYGLGGSVTWLLNRHVRVSATEDFTAMRGAAPGQSGSGSFNRNITLLTIGFGL